MGAGLLAYQAAREVRASAPKQVMDALEDLRTRVVAAEENVGLMRASIIQWEAQMGGTLEAVEDSLQRIDTKRRRAQAAAQRAEQAAERDNGGNDPNALSDAELLQRARGQGLV